VLTAGAAVPLVGFVTYVAISLLMILGMAAGICAREETPT
jgi:hypothetical protein